MHYDWSMLVETVFNTVSTLLCRRNDINVKNHDTMVWKVRWEYGENYAQEHTRKSGAYLRAQRNNCTFAAMIQKAFIDACFGALNPAKFINHPRQDGNGCPRDMYITCPQGQTYISAWTDVVYSCGRVLQEPKDKEKQFVSRFFCIQTTFFLVHCSVVAVRWCTFAAE